jgi:hypothetical protein
MAAVVTHIHEYYRARPKIAKQQQMMTDQATNIAFYIGR